MIYIHKYEHKNQNNSDLISLEEIASSSIISIHISYFHLEIISASKFNKIKDS